MKHEKRPEGLGLGESQIKGYQNQDEVHMGHWNSEVSDFSLEIDVTTYITVVKVRLAEIESARRLWISWGDFETDRISFNHEINYTDSPELGLPISLPKRRYEALHVYDKPKDSSEFEKNITVRIQDHSGSIRQCSKTINISHIF
ncbi:hypothetical protein [Maribacter luteus]|uniref:Uncharacterized protein n=1 Tax=Maribacter luteus TaxID=2594478 RepID=A0A6I2MLR3_9FLAO|nr:hypothetical protein [Maribacter luteus]MRX63737.1 hypothetical protein [Maribacter luteus]